MNYNFNHVDFIYSPYPFGFINNLFDTDLYNELADNFPDKQSLIFHKEYGGKYRLSEEDGRDLFMSFIKNNDIWAEFYNLIKSQKFVKDILQMLCSNQIDLGLEQLKISNTNQLAPLSTQLTTKTKNKIMMQLLNRKRLSSRFEFSIGGDVLPHTDATYKVVSIVLCMMKHDEWPDSTIGGTAICEPKDNE